MTAPETSHPIRAAGWMTGSIIGFSSMAVAGREIGTALDTFEIMMYRSAIGFVTILLVASLAGTRHQISTRHMHLHLTRNIFHFAGQNLWLYALLLIPMAQLFALEFSYPIIVALTAPLFLGERLTPVRVFAAAIGFIGILIVARPWVPGAVPIGLLAAMLCAFGFAGAAIVTKRLTRVVSVTCILFWLATIQFTLGLICAGYDGQIRLPSSQTVPWVVLIGLAGLGSHFCLTRALSLAPASVVTPIDFLRLPLIGIIGMLAYNEGLDIWVFVGGAIIFSGNWLNIRTENRRAK